VSARRVYALLTLLLLLSPAAAAPTDSLLGVDMRAERRARRVALAEEIGSGTLVLFAARPAGHGDYRPDPSFRYLTGVEHRGGALVLRVTRPEATEVARDAARLADRIRGLAEEIRGIASNAYRRRAREIAGEAMRLSRQARTALREVEKLEREGRGPARIVERLYLPPARHGAGKWESPRLGPGPEAAKATGFEEVRDVARLFDDLRADLAEGERLHLLTRADNAPALEVALEAVREEREDLVVFDAARSLAHVRSVKSPEEVARIRRACEVTCAGLRESMRSSRPGLHEFELQAVLEYVCRRGGAPRQAFPSIVGSGPNGTILHYRANLRRIDEGDLVLMDVGGEYMGYAADVTRTFPANGRFTGEQARLYDIVLEAQRAALAAVRPGVTVRDVDGAARAVIKEAGYGRAFTHGTSHFVGLDVHDPAPRGPLRAGMVLTVEPGIYLAEEGVGIRIEDTVLVTEEGVEVLSPGAPKTRKEIEALMRKKGIGNLPIR
jgi:Xaa-Pro aminopeptidase